MTDLRPSSMRRDIASAYIATAARVASWIIVSAIVYRKLGAAALGLVTLVRATVGILSYTSLGLGPALVRKLTEVAGGTNAAQETVAQAIPLDRAQPPILQYAQNAPAPPIARELVNVYAAGKELAVASGIIAMAAAFVYAGFFDRLHPLTMPADVASALVSGFGLGIAFRLISEAPSGLLQARDRIAVDNILIASAEITWAALTVVFFTGRTVDLPNVGIAFAVASGGLCAVRYVAAWIETRQLASVARRFDFAVMRQLLAFGVLVVIAQVADFLYAPTDCILINHFISPEAVAWYSPAIQIDAGLLLLVSGMAAVLFPKSAIAHVAGDRERLRRYYVYGTLSSFFLLTFAACVIWLFSNFIFRLWLGDPMSATQRILPLVLIHTIVGGSSAVGRSVLLGMGKVKPFTIAVLIAGVSNVLLSYIFVRHLNLGLNGIIYGTIVVVIVRCAIWMPWYTLKSLRQAG